MEQERIPVPGEFYRHFKNKLYQIRAVAYHSETKEKMVVYQAMYGSFDVYVRPYDMFMSEVDHVKYPDVTQKYRFEKVDLNNLNNADAQLVSMQSLDAEEKIDPVLEQFLDASSCQQKLNILTGYRSRIDENTLAAMALSMDIELDEGTFDSRYESLKNCIKAHARYETERLR